MCKFTDSELGLLIFILSHSLFPVFKAAPPTPPSRAQEAAQINAEDDNYGKSIVRLVKNKNYIILLITYGINVGVFYAISTLLNQVVLGHFPVRFSIVFLQSSIFKNFVLISES